MKFCFYSVHICHRCLKLHDLGRFPPIRSFLTSYSPIPTVSISPPSSDETSQDLHIGLPPSLAEMVEKVMTRGASCSDSSVKRQSGTVLDCVTYAATTVLYNSFEGYSLNNLLSFDTSVTIPEFLDPSVQSQLHAFQMDAQQVALSLGITPAQAVQAGTNIWDLAYVRYGLGQTLSTDNVIPGYYFKNATNTGCPPEAPKKTSLSPLICQFTNCLGDYDSQLCTTVRPVAAQFVITVIADYEKKEWKDCECLNQAGPNNLDMIDMVMYDLQPAALRMWILNGEKPDSTPTPTPTLGPNPKCYQTPGSGAYITFSSLSSAISQFCASASGLRAGGNGNTNFYADYTYYADTLDQIRLVLSGTAVQPVDEASCNSDLGVILNGCDGSPSNPMNWRWGNSPTPSFFPLYYRMTPYLAYSFLAVSLCSYSRLFYLPHAQLIAALRWTIHPRALELYGHTGAN